MEQNFRSKHITNQLVSCRMLGVGVGATARCCLWDLERTPPAARCPALLCSRSELRRKGCSCRTVEYWRRERHRAENWERGRGRWSGNLSSASLAAPGRHSPVVSHSGTTRGRACGGRVDGSWAVFLPWTVSKPAQVCRVFVSHTKFLSSLPDPCSAYSIRPIRID